MGGSALIPDRQSGELETARLSFEPLQEAHATLLHAALQDERLYRWIPQEPLDLEQLRLRYRHLEARQSPDGTEAWLNWALRLKEEQVFAGTLEATIHANNHASIAYFRKYSGS